MRKDGLEGSWGTGSLVGSCCPLASPHIQSGVWGPREGEGIERPWQAVISANTALQIQCVSSGAAKPAVGLPQGCPFTLGTGTAMSP